MTLDPNREFWNPEIETMSRDELQDLQMRRLKRQLRYNYDNSIFYRDSFDRAGIKPEEVLTWEDFRRVPTMTKDDQRRAQEESIERFGHPYGMLACAPREKIVRICSTSGTTGMPTLYTLTQHDIDVANEFHARKIWRGPCRPGDIILHASSLSMFTGGIPIIDGMESFGLCVVPVGSDSGSARVLQFIDLCKPDFLICTPSFAEYLIQECPKVLGKPATELGLKGLGCGAEPGSGIAEVVARVKKGFGVDKMLDGIGGAHVFHGYGCGTEPYPGMHLVSEDHCILELLDLETREPVELAEGASGEMCYTYLDWEGSPLLRYRLGDVLQVFLEACECGDHRLRFKMIGRADDMLIVKGVNVYPAALKSAVMSFHPRVTGEFRILLDQPGPRVTPPLKLQVEHGEGVDPDALLLLDREMRQKMHGDLLVTPSIEFLPPNTLERSTHKSKLIVKLYEKQ
jgi:phenylacetate-CoA ligase